MAFSPFVSPQLGPVESLSEKLRVLILSASVFPAIAFFVFYKGLHRYESGNRFGLRL